THPRRAPLLSRASLTLTVLSGSVIRGIEPSCVLRCLAGPPQAHPLLGTTPTRLWCLSRSLRDCHRTALDRGDEVVHLLIQIAEAQAESRHCDRAVGNP